MHKFEEIDSFISGLYQEVWPKGSINLVDILAFKLKTLSDNTQGERFGVWFLESDGERLRPVVVFDAKNTRIIEANPKDQDDESELFNKIQTNNFTHENKVTTFSLYNTQGLVGALIIEGHQFKEEDKIYLQAFAEFLSKLHERSFKDSAIEKLNAFNKTLEFEVKKRTELVRRTQKQMMAQEQLASIGSLAAGISHELKNPISIALNGANALATLLGEGGDMDSAKLKEFVDVIQDSTGRANSIIQSMLKQSQQGESEFVYANINEVISEAINLSFHAMKAKNILPNIDIQKDFAHPFTVYHSPENISRVLTNIIDNAFQAMHGKSQSDDNYTPSLKVKTLKESEENLQIIIEDNGPRDE
jgi:signal transduction histidine kinase